MSIIQVEDLVSYQLRSNYLNSIADGVGERVITLNDSFLNTAGFKAAGWRPNASNIKRTHSPPIPTAIASEYFQAPQRVAGLTLEDEGEGGGMVTRDGGDTVGPGITTKRRRRKEQLEEEDSSDLSDDSDEENDQRAAQQIKFAKMPIRNRSGSSPLTGSSLRQSTTMTSPPRMNAPGPRRGSHSALEAVQERARADTITSSEMSSDNEFDASAFHRQREASRNASKASRMLQKHTSDSSIKPVSRVQSDLLEEEEEEDDDSGGSDTSSAFAGSMDSVSLLENGEMPIDPSPTEHIVGTVPKQLTRNVTVKSKPAPSVLQALPPPRPISTVQPKSLLSAAIKTRRTKAAMPFESFASLSGQGDPNPLSLRIWAPFSTTAKPYEVLIRRNVHENMDRQVSVADLIGLSLWRYAEEKLEPPIQEEKMNVNRWTLRLVEDEEVDYDFPPLERNKPVVSFTTVNNRAARTRGNSRPYDEFALVEATEEQFQQNQALTPQFKQEAVNSSGNEDFPPYMETIPSSTNLSVPKGTQPVLNPLLTTMTALRKGSLADATPVGHTPTPTRSGKVGRQKLLRVNILSLDATPGQMVTLDITTDTYFQDVLDMVCKKRQLDKAAHVLKLSGSGTVVPVDKTVESIGSRSDLDLVRRRFGADGPLTMSGSPKSTSHPKMPMPVERPEFRRVRRGTNPGASPLAQDGGKQDELGSAVPYRKWTVWRKQPMRFVSMNERVLALDGDYLNIMPVSTTRTMFESQTKPKTEKSIPLGEIVGCKVRARHHTNFKIVVFKPTDTNKRYDFEAKSSNEAAEIVFEINKATTRYHQS